MADDIPAKRRSMPDAVMLWLLSWWLRAAPVQGGSHGVEVLGWLWGGRARSPQPETAASLRGGSADALPDHREAVTKGACSSTHG